MYRNSKETIQINTVIVLPVHMISIVNHRLPSSDLKAATKQKNTFLAFHWVITNRHSSFTYLELTFRRPTPVPHVPIPIRNSDFLRSSRNGELGQVKSECIILPRSANIPPKYTARQKNSSLIPEGCHYSSYIYRQGCCFLVFRLDTCSDVSYDSIAMTPILILDDYIGNACSQPWSPVQNDGCAFLSAAIRFNTYYGRLWFTA